MIIRPALPKDTPQIVAMGAKFYATTSYATIASYDEASALVLIDMMREAGVLLVAECDGVLVGMVGLIVTPFLFNHALSSAHEVMWWVDPDARTTGAGVALLRAVDDACIAKGAILAQMMNLANSPPHTAGLYERLGYVHSETSYTKVLH